MVLAVLICCTSVTSLVYAVLTYEWYQAICSWYGGPSLLEYLDELQPSQVSDPRP